MLGAYGKLAHGQRDPYFSNVSLLVHADGANGSTTITDSTGLNTLTPYGNAQISTMQSKFGGSSLYFDGSGDAVAYPAAAIGPTDTTFTVECFLYMTAIPTNDSNNISGLISLDGQRALPTNYLAFGPYSAMKLHLRWYDGAVKSCLGSTTLSLNTWYHISCSVNNNIIKMFVNGAAEVLTGSTTLVNRPGTTNECTIGSSYYGAISGYIDEFRITKGVARYTQDFVPPTQPFFNN